MEKKKAKFIYMEGLNYTEKVITYYDYTNDFRIEDVTNIHFDGTNVSKNIENAMIQGASQGIKSIISKYNQPIWLERTKLPSEEGTEAMIITGEQNLILNCEKDENSPISEYCQKYKKWHQNFLTSRKDARSDKIYYQTIELYRSLMRGEIDYSILELLCESHPEEIYLEILYALHGMAGVELNYELQQSSRKKVKSMLKEIEYCSHQFYR